MFRNFTPHEVNVAFNNGVQLNFPSEGVARCSTSSEKVGEVGGIEIFRNVFEVEGLPEPNGVDFFIVSSPVLQALAGQRSDLVGPDTSPAGNPVRNDAGQVIAVRRFQTV